MKDHNQLKLHFSPIAIVRVLSSIVGLLMLAHLVGMVVTQYFPQRLILGIYSLVDVSAEQNIPTLFSCCLFLLNGLLFFSLWRTGRGRGEKALIWFAMALLFVFLSV